MGLVSVFRATVIWYGPPLTGLLLSAVVDKLGLPLRTLAPSPGANPA